MKVVASFYPIDTVEKEDYIKICKDVTGGEIISLNKLGMLEILKAIIGKDVHAHGRGFPFPEASALFSKRSIYTPHFNHIGSGFLGKLMRRFLINRYNKVVAQTEYGRKNYIRDGINPDKITLLPIPVDYKYFSKPFGGLTFKKMYGLKPDEPFALVVGIRPMKNPLVIAKACEKSGIKVVMVGHKDMKHLSPGFEWLLPPKELLEFDNDNLILTGHIEYDTLIRAYDAATMFINSSDSGQECFCLAAYEAAAAGVPLCLPDFGVFDVFKNAALFHKNTNRDELSKNISIYLDNPDIRKNNSALSRQIAMGYDYEIVRVMYENFYKSLGII